MQRVDKLQKLLADGSLDETFSQRYGAENLQKQKERFDAAISRFGKTYGFDRSVNVYTVPYSLLLSGGGADMALPLNLDAIAICVKNDVNVSRFQARAYFGEDNVDLYQKGPYEPEMDKTSGVFRGLQQAFRNFGFEVYGMDIFLDADTLPESGLCDPSHLAITLAHIFNLVFNKGALSPLQLSKAVQWAVTNYCQSDSNPLCAMASIQGKALVGDFTNPELPIIEEVAFPVAKSKFVYVNTGLCTPDIPENEVDKRLDDFMARFDKALDSMTEEDFYTTLADLGPDCDKAAALFLGDYYTQENLSALYESCAQIGTGAPALEITVPINPTVLGGSSKWRSHIYKAYWASLCCVSEEALPAFTAAMTALFGENSMEIVAPAYSGAQLLFK